MAAANLGCFGAPSNRPCVKFHLQKPACLGCGTSVALANIAWPKKGEHYMLVFTRRTSEEIVIQGNIRVCVLAIGANRARIGIVAPDSVRVDRLETHKMRAAERLVSEDTSGESAPESLELKRRIVNYLGNLNRPGFNNLKVTVLKGNVLITGRVRSYHLKQLATSGCQRVAGVLTVRNEIEVDDDAHAKSKK